MSDLKDLKERVDKFISLKLPGQPSMTHMGTSYLVMDLWREVQRLRAINIDHELNFAAAVEEVDRLVRDSQELRKVNPRAWKLLTKRVPFMVVRTDEPYASKVMQFIKCYENTKGTWTLECQRWANDFLGEGWDEKNLD